MLLTDLSGYMSLCALNAFITGVPQSPQPFLHNSWRGQLVLQELKKTSGGAFSSATGNYVISADGCPFTPLVHDQVLKASHVNTGSSICFWYKDAQYQTIG